MQQRTRLSANNNEERIRNYLHVVNELIGHDAEELLRGVNFIRMSEIEWQAALNNVDNPAISRSQRAVCFHTLIEQGTKDALHGDPRDWQILSGEDQKAREAMSWTAPERISLVIGKIRQEFPNLALECLR